MACPQCKGTGKTKVKVSERGKPDHSFQMDCLTCEGTGNATPEQAKAWHDMMNSWCRCGNPSGRTRPYNYRNGAHGFECCDCGKITQTG
jgi:hypothetical protein